MKTDLKTWCIHYIRSRDAMERKLVSIDEQGDKVVATYKNRVVTFVPQDVLSVDAAKLSGIVTVVCLQTIKNFQTLVSGFGEFAKNDQLTVIFLNPAVGDKWVVKPSVHAAVADKSNLKAGLQSLYDMVPAV